MNLDALVNEHPKFHMDGGEPVSYGLGRAPLSYIAEKVKGDLNTLETGAGISTVLFALLGANHVCITPNKGEVGRIVAYCGQRQIPVLKINFVIEKSEYALPKLEASGLDLVLIDGRHAFPTPFIDWYYTAEKLKLGGLMVVDDTQLWTGKILKKFMLSEPEWQLDKIFSNTCCFIKIKEGSHLKWWGLQPFVRKRSSLSILCTRMRLVCSHYGGVARRKFGSFLKE